MYLQTIKISIILVMLVLAPLVSVAKTTIETNPNSKLKSYHFTQDGFKFDLIQRLPDQTRAFFMARGFSNQVANDIGVSCIFQGIGTNATDSDNPTPIEVSLSEWQIHIGTRITNIKMKEIWEKEWDDTRVSRSSKIAYKWATFPSHQIFTNTGDYGWGMISFNLPPKTIFDLRISWKNNNKHYEAWIKALECPDDR